MNKSKLFLGLIMAISLGILVSGIANAQTGQPMTDFGPKDRPLIDRAVEKVPYVVPDDLPEGFHFLEGSHRLILQDLSVVILTADVAGSEQEVADYLLGSGHVTTVDAIDVAYQTPVLADIEGYDVVLTWNNFLYNDPVAIGDLLADYMDLGKGVIPIEFAYYSFGGLQGRFMAEYSPFSHGSNTYVDVSLGTYDADHPLMADVSAVTEFFPVDVSLTGVGTCVAWWDNDWPFVAYNHVNNRAVGINGYVGGLYREWTGDMLQVILNSVLFVTGGVPEACHTFKHDGVPASYFGAEIPGDRIVTFIDPADCPGSPTYPFEITSVDFQLLAVFGWYPADVDIIVYDMADPGDFCQGPGAELCRFTFTCDASFEYPNWGTAPFPEPCCMDGPFFIGIEYLDPVISIATYDYGPPVQCDVWYYTGGGWSEWYAMWGGGMGYPILSVNGETYSPACEEQEIPTLSEWGMMIMGLLLLVFGTVAVVRKRKAVLTKSF